MVELPVWLVCIMLGVCVGLPLATIIILILTVSEKHLAKKKEQEEKLKRLKDREWRH